MTAAAALEYLLFALPFLLLGLLFAGLWVWDRAWRDAGRAHQAAHEAHDRQDAAP
jgi:hypothetical protein